MVKNDRIEFGVYNNEYHKVSYMTGWTKHGIEAQGYKEHPDSDVLEMSFFGLIRVYSLQGILFEDSCPDKKTEIIDLSDCCSVAIAQSVNEALKMLVACDELLCDDEEKWLTGKKKEIPLISEFPFLFIYFKITKPAKLKGGYRKEEDSCIHTFEAFPEISEEIARWKDKELPGIVTSLTVNFSTLNQSIKLVPAHCIFFGITKEGRVLYDLTFTVTANVLVASHKNIREINKSLCDSKELLPVLTKDVYRHFYAALNEPDKMKQFLFYFHFIERYTHSVYKTINCSDKREIFDIPQRINDSASNFLKGIFSESKNLAQRFHWCAIIAWDNIEERDVANFIEAKKVRDQLSHGEHVEESELPVEKIKGLALKILSAKKKITFSLITT